MHITTNPAFMASVLAAGAMLSACSEEKIPELPDRDELYAREFIKEFGTPAPGHDWSMAKTAGLRVNAPSPVHLRVYAEIDGERYIFADLPGYCGENAVPVTIPKGLEELIITADDAEYRCSPSGILDLASATPARGSRATHITIKDPGTRFPEVNDYVTVGEEETSYAIINLDENPALKKILEDPYHSEYLIQVSDNGFWLGGPLYPNASNHYYPSLGSAQSFDMYPLYFDGGDGNRTNPRLSLDMLLNKSDTDKQPRDIYNLFSAGKNDMYMYTSSNGVDWKVNFMPDSENGPYIRTPCTNVDIDLYDDMFISYSINSAYSNGRTSYSFNWFNYTVWNKTAFFDAQIKDMNTCYCSTLFYKEVPVKWTVDGHTIETKTALYAMYHAPKSPAEKRPDKPQIFFLEHHDFGDMYWIQEFEDAKEVHHYKWRLMAEDLGGSFDWDFNDLVVDFTDILTKYTPSNVPDNFTETGETIGGYKIYADESGEVFRLAPYSQLYPQFENESLDKGMMVRKITVTPMASGGTLPIYLAWHGKLTGKEQTADPDMMLSEYIASGAKTDKFAEGDFIIGEEMHKWLGASSHTSPLNVGEYKTHSGRDVTFYISQEEEKFNSGFYEQHNFNGFRILVDHDKTLNISTDNSVHDNPDIKSVDLSAWNGTTITNKPSTNDTSTIPQLLIVSAHNAPWTIEGANFGKVYSGFNGWINLNFSPTWLFGYDSNFTVKEK